MTSGSEGGFVLHDRTVLQFAPHFSVYLLSSDTVCLYSEDRKFLLYGELYCALAVAITERGTPVGDLVRGLERDFPAAQIREALQRLIDRGYAVVATPSSHGTVAAYWASLGL